MINKKYFKHVLYEALYGNKQGTNSAFCSIVDQDKDGFYKNDINDTLKAMKAYGYIQTTTIQNKFVLTEKSFEKAKQLFPDPFEG